MATLQDLIQGGPVAINLGLEEFAKTLEEQGRPVIHVDWTPSPPLEEDIKNILEAAGSSRDLTVATFVYMVDLGDFGRMNQIYADYFKVLPPGRTTVGVTSLPAGALVEITCTALAGDEH